MNRITDEQSFLPLKLRKRRDHTRLDLELDPERRAQFHDYCSASLRAMRRADADLATQYAALACRVALLGDLA